MEYCTRERRALGVGMGRIGLVLLAGVATIALAGCATNRTGALNADYANLSGPQIQASVADLSQRYAQDPRNKVLGIHYAAALRAAGQTEPAVTVLENLISVHQGDAELGLAYAKALSAAGRFEQALRVVDNAMNPVTPDWDALSVRGAILDQMGRPVEARQAYTQALLLAPQEARLYANLGLSYAMTGELVQAEANLRQAASMPGANSKVRQNLALVLGLQGQFEAARAIYAAELPPEQVQANMDYIRALLTQQDRWQAIRNDTPA